MKFISISCFASFGNFITYAQMQLDFTSHHLTSWVVSIHCLATIRSGLRVVAWLSYARATPNIYIYLFIYLRVWFKKKMYMKVVWHHNMEFSTTSTILNNFLFFFSFSSIEEVITKFAQLTPQERAKRYGEVFLLRFLLISLCLHWIFTKLEFICSIIWLEQEVRKPRSKSLDPRLQSLPFSVINSHSALFINFFCWRLSFLLVT
jgi:CBS domain containing-hemolysin-like protein